MGIITRMRRSGISLKSTALTAAVVLLIGLVACHGSPEEDWGPRESEGTWRPRFDYDEPFLLKESKPLIKTEAGEMRVVTSSYGRKYILDGPMRIGFIMMEPKTLFVPQYLDSDLILFIRTGEAKVGFIYKDRLAERRLKMGDVYRIPAGSAFYLVNVEEGQRLHIICSFDTSQSLRFGSFQSFFVGGGTYPTSILSGFGSEILENAFNVTHAEIKELLRGQVGGPIVYISESRAPKAVWSKFLELKEDDKLQHMKSMVGFEDEEGDDDDDEIRGSSTSSGWFWRKIMLFWGGSSEIEKRGSKKPEDVKGKGKSPDSYNIYSAKPDYKNNYGWSIAVDGSTYPYLKKSGFSVYYVNLSAGSMMAPHLNPTAMEYGVVVAGSGTVQIVYPNGTMAMNAELTVGDVFRVPRYFPFCQVASRTGPMEFFGFTTSSCKNRPQFLAGSASLLRTMWGPELAASLGLSEDRLHDIIRAQSEAVILPSASAAPPLKADRSY